MLAILPNSSGPGALRTARRGVKVDAMTLLLIVACLAAFLALLEARRANAAKHQLSRANVWAGQEAERLRGENARLAAAAAPLPRKSAEERRDERLDKQLEAVRRGEVAFHKRRVMGGGELGVFYAAMAVTRQPQPEGRYPFYVFPQVNLGQILGAKTEQVRLRWQGDQAHQAINSKRCDLLIADKKGWPVAVIEYQGEAHDLDGTAGRRDQIKRIAVEGAGIRYVEIEAGTSAAEMRRIVQGVFDEHMAARTKS